MGHDVFISHSAKDKKVADAVCAALEANGLRCWIAPRDILPGESWTGSILNGIASCRAMVLVFSGHANASAQIRREVERAVHRDIPIAPVRIENVMPEGDMEYFLSSQHWMDALTPPFEKHLRELSLQVRVLLAISGTALPAAPELVAPPPEQHPARPAAPAGAAPPAAPENTAPPPRDAPALRSRPSAGKTAIAILLAFGLLVALPAAWAWRADLRRTVSGSFGQAMMPSSKYVSRPAINSFGASAAD